MAPALPCKRQTEHHESGCNPEIASEKNSKTVCSCTVESHESTRQRAETSRSKNHEDHFTGKVYENSGCKGRGGIKNGEQLETIPALDFGEVKSKRDVILEAQRDKMKVHFATLMDTCHLKNAESEPKLQQYTKQTHADKRRLWSLCSVYLTKAHLRPRWLLLSKRNMNVIARLPSCDGQAADAVSALLKYNGRMLPDC